MSSREDFARRELLERDPALLDAVEKLVTPTTPSDQQKPPDGGSAGLAPEKPTLLSHNSLFSQPILNEAALYGLAGNVVSTVFPHSEAAAASLLLHFLVGYGNQIGRSAHYRVESTIHHCNLFFGCVGQTSKSRKGTSWDRIRELLARIEPTWARERLQSGLTAAKG